MAPFASLLLWLFHMSLDSKGVEENKGLVVLSYILYFTFNAIFWIQALISYTNFVFFLQEEAENV